MAEKDLFTLQLKLHRSWVDLGPQSFGQICTKQKVVIPFQPDQPGTGCMQLLKGVKQRFLLIKDQCGQTNPEIKQVAQDAEGIRCALQRPDKMQQQAVVGVIRMMQVGVSKKDSTHSRQIVPLPGQTVNS